jgi:hypothetical protein
MKAYEFWCPITVYKNLLISHTFKAKAYFASFAFWQYISTAGIVSKYFVTIPVSVHYSVISHSKLFSSCDKL